jgi:hypothetical protein
VVQLTNLKGHFNHSTIKAYAISMFNITKMPNKTTIQIYHDDYSCFIIFNSKDSAIAAKKYVQDNHAKIIGYPIELHVPSLCHSKKTTSFQVEYEQKKQK